MLKCATNWCGNALHTNQNTPLLWHGLSAGLSMEDRSPNLLSHESHCVALTKPLHYPIEVTINEILTVRHFVG